MIRELQFHQIIINRPISLVLRFEPLAINMLIPFEEKCVFLQSLGLLPSQRLTPSNRRIGSSKFQIPSQSSIRRPDLLIFLFNPDMLSLSGALRSPFNWNIAHVPQLQSFKMPTSSHSWPKFEALHPLIRSYPEFKGVFACQNKYGTMELLPLEVLCGGVREYVVDR